MLENFILGFCLWDLPAVIPLIIIIVAFIIQERKHKRKMTELRNLWLLESVQKEQP